MDFTSLFNMQGMMFCVLALGWYLRKKGMIDKSGKALLSNLVMNVTLPASIIKSFQMEFSMDPDHLERAQPRPLSGME